MNALLLGTLLAVALVGCTEKQAPTAKLSLEKRSAADVQAGKAIAERGCKGCHGLDGKGAAPGIPHLAAQRERYLLASLKEYKEGKRSHAALRDMMVSMSETDARNVVAYYASLVPVAVAGGNVQHSSPYEEGKILAAGCTKCHGEDGNSRTPGTPSLAGQQPHYLVVAIQEYHQGERKAFASKSMSRAATKLELERLAQYFSAQTPVQRCAPAVGNPVAGEPLTAMCGGCHGVNGVSSDASTPSLAGQDPQYLVRSIKAYRTTRQHWGMQRFVAGLGDVPNVVEG